MAQTSSLESLESRDVDVAGAKKEPESGFGATFLDKGDRQIDNAKLGTTFASIFEWADNYRLRYVSEWLKAYQQYNAEGSDTSKEAWQSQLFVPKSTQAVDIIVDRVISFLFANEDWFDILPETRIQDDVVTRAKKCLKWQFRKSDAEQAIATSIKDAVICGNGPMKVFFASELVPRTVVDFVANEPMEIAGEQIDTGGSWKFVEQLKLIRSMRFEPLMPTDVWLDPSGRGRFVIQRTRRSLSDLWALSRDQKDDDGTIVIPAVYDAKIVGEIKTTGGDPQREAQSSIIRRDTPYLTSDQGVDVYEYWGDFIDPANGNVLYRNILATFVNKQWCIRRPQSSPLRHGMAPFIAFQPKLLPHEVYGSGILRWTGKIQDALNRQGNIIADKALLQVPTLEVDPMAARDPAELSGTHPKWSPGRMWRRRGQDKQIFFPTLGFAPPTQEDFLWFDRLSNMFDQQTGVNEFASGTPVSNNRKTKTEVQDRAQATQQTFNGIAQHIEKYSMSPLLKMVYLLMVQFETEYDDDSLLRMFGDRPEEQQFVASLKGMSDEERWRLLFLDAEFRCTGIQMQITRAQRLNSLDSLLQRLESDPTLAALLDKREILTRYLKLYDVSPTIILTGGEALLQAQEQMQLQAMMAPPAAAGHGQPTPDGANQHNQLAAAQAQAGQPPPEDGGPPQ